MRHFLLGFLAGLGVIFLCLILILVTMPFLLVIENDPVQAEIGIVLGGGGGSRLRKGVELYDSGFVTELLLVDLKAGSWNHMVKHLCPDCDLEHKKITILSGSTSTTTDAQRTFAYCQNAEVRKVLVITDPYHTRRAALAFQQRFQGSGIEVRVVSSNDYGHLLSPVEKWWTDPATRETIWLEFGKCLHTMVKDYLVTQHSSLNIGSLNIGSDQDNMLIL
jgi:uncharacterized SAM-binding protein YcdF (DUF218 family)